MEGYQTTTGLLTHVSRGCTHRLLIDLLESDDPKTVAVALFDLGEFVRFYPNGKHIVKRLGAKKVAMKLMTHENPEVQKQALQCISKMMVNKWEFVK